LSALACFGLIDIILTNCKHGSQPSGFAKVFLQGLVAGRVVDYRQP
jgi:hypothetical protein